MWYDVLKVRRNAKRIEIVEAYKRLINEPNADIDILYKKSVVIARKEAIDALNERKKRSVLVWTVSFSIILLSSYYFFKSGVSGYNMDPITLQSCLTKEGVSGLRINEKSFIDGANKNGYIVTESGFDDDVMFSAYKDIDDVKIELIFYKMENDSYICNYITRTEKEFQDGNKQLSFMASIRIINNKPNYYELFTAINENTERGNFNYTEELYIDDIKNNFEYIPKSDYEYAKWYNVVKSIKTKPYIDTLREEYAKLVQ